MDSLPRVGKEVNVGVKVRSPLANPAADRLHLRECNPGVIFHHYESAVPQDYLESTGIGYAC